MRGIPDGEAPRRRRSPVLPLARRQGGGVRAREARCCTGLSIPSRSSAREAFNRAGDLHQRVHHRDARQPRSERTIGSTKTQACCICILPIQKAISRSFRARATSRVNTQGAIIKGRIGRSNRSGPPAPGIGGERLRRDRRGLHTHASPQTLEPGGGVDSDGIASFAIQSETQTSCSTRRECFARIWDAAQSRISIPCLPVLKLAHTLQGD